MLTFGNFVACSDKALLCTLRWVDGVSQRHSTGMHLVSVLAHCVTIRSITSHTRQVDFDLRRTTWQCSTHLVRVPARLVIAIKQKLLAKLFDIAV